MARESVCAGKAYRLEVKSNNVPCSSIYCPGLNLSYETFTLSLILKGQCPVLDTLYLFWTKKWFLVSFVFIPYKADKVQQNPISQKCQESLIDKHFGCRSTVSARQNNQIKGGCRCPGICRRGVYSSFTTTSQ